MKFVLPIVLLLLVGCNSTPTTTIDADSSLRKKLEAAIAREMLQEVRQDLPKLKGSIRSTYLRQKTEQFRQSVDQTAITNAIKQEYQLLQYLDAAEHTRWHSQSLEAKVRSLSSLNVDLTHIENLILNELARIDQTLAVLTQNTDLNIPDHMNTVRQSASYPVDSFDGRQQYLDELHTEMNNAFDRWQHLFIRSDRGIELRGSETADESFIYDAGVLTIGLGDVKDLPDFELASIAIFYGFPGRAIFPANDAAKSLKDLLDLPGYTLGWSWYVLDLIAARDLERTKTHLYLSKLLTTLALADLRQHTGTWQDTNAVAFIARQTPYSRNRIRQMLTTVKSKPGYYLAAFAGKGKLNDLLNYCNSDCEPALHQRLIELGPIPFEMLTERLRSEGLIQ